MNINEIVLTREEKEKVIYKLYDHIVINYKSSRPPTELEIAEAISLATAKKVVEEIDINLALVEDGFWHSYYKINYKTWQGIKKLLEAG